MNCAVIELRVVLLMGFNKSLFGANDSVKMLHTLWHRIAPSSNAHFGIKLRAVRYG